MFNGGGFDSWLKRNQTISQTMHDERRKRNIKHNMGVDQDARREYRQEKKDKN